MSDMIKLFGAIGIAILSIFLTAFALTNLWTWFIVPFGIVKISYAWALGLSVLINYFTNDYTYKVPIEGHDRDKVMHDITVSIAKPLFAYGFGWLIFLFM